MKDRDGGRTRLRERAFRKRVKDIRDASSDERLAASTDDEQEHADE
jgi:hypothetical protein